MRRIRSKNTKRKKGKGIYILPNFLTSMGLFSGFYSIIATIDKKFTYAAIAIFVAAIFDSLDGRVARITGSSSKFGVEYDSLSDVIAFGVAPALLAYMWALKPYGKFGWLAAFFFIACGALRLARFNIQVDTAQKKHFLGLPIPAAACVIASSVLFVNELGFQGEFTSVFMPILVYVLAFFMVSGVRYYSFKDIEFLKRHPFQTTLLCVMMLVIIFIHPEYMLFIVMAGYFLSGPVYTLVQWKKIFAKEMPGTTESESEKGGH